MSGGGGSGRKSGEKWVDLDAVIIGIKKGHLRFEIFVDPLPQPRSTHDPAGRAFAPHRPSPPGRTCPGTAAGVPGMFHRHAQG